MGDVRDARLVVASGLYQHLMVDVFNAAVSHLLLEFSGHGNVVGNDIYFCRVKQREKDSHIAHSLELDMHMVVLRKFLYKIIVVTHRVATIDEI